MGIAIAVTLVLVALVLFVGARVGRIDPETVHLLNQVAGIIAGLGFILGLFLGISGGEGTTPPPTTNTPNVAAPATSVARISATPTDTHTLSPMSTPTVAATDTPTQTAIVPIGPPTRSSGPAEGKIAFTCQITSTNATPDTNHDEICIIDADGSNERRLTDNDWHDGNPFFSPDGKWVVFESFGDGLFWRWSSTENRAESIDSRLSSGSSALLPAISPDGEWVALAVTEGGESQIWIVDANGNNQDQITSGPGIHTSPVWSPDGRQLAYARSTASQEGGQYRYFTIDLNEREPQPVPLDYGQVDDITGGRIDWSPDGHWIAFHAGPSFQHAIYVTSVYNEAVYRLSSGEHDDTEPAFSPDGNWLTFSSLQDGDREIWIMRLDGSTRLQVTYNSRFDYQPRWGH